MKRIDMNDLGFVAKVKSDIMYMIWDVENSKSLNKNKIARELKKLVCEIIELEDIFTEGFAEGINEITTK